MTAEFLSDERQGEARAGIKPPQTLQPNVFPLNNGDENARVAQAVSIRGRSTQDHGDFIAIHEPGAVNTILVNFVRQVLATVNLETEVCEKVRRSRKEAQAGDLVAFRFFNQRLDQQAADPTAFARRKHSDRPYFGKMHAVEVQGATTEDETVSLSNDEIANIFRQLG